MTHRHHCYVYRCVSLLSPSLSYMNARERDIFKVSKKIMKKKKKPPIAINNMYKVNMALTKKKEC